MVDQFAVVQAGILNTSTHAQCEYLKCKRLSHIYPQSAFNF